MLINLSTSSNRAILQDVYSILALGNIFLHEAKSATDPALSRALEYYTKVCLVSL